MCATIEQEFDSHRAQNVGGPYFSVFEMHMERLTADRLTLQGSAEKRVPWDLWRQEVTGSQIWTTTAHDWKKGPERKKRKYGEMERSGNVRTNNSIRCYRGDTVDVVHPVESRQRSTGTLQRTMLRKYPKKSLKTRGRRTTPS